jgi:hypothetical protein
LHRFAAHELYDASKGLQDDIFLIQNFLKWRKSAPVSTASGSQAEGIAPQGFCEIIALRLH